MDRTRQQDMQNMPEQTIAPPPAPQPPPPAAMFQPPPAAFQPPPSRPPVISSELPVEEQFLVAILNKAPAKEVGIEDTAAGNKLKSSAHNMDFDERATSSSERRLAAYAPEMIASHQALDEMTFKILLHSGGHLIDAPESVKIYGKPGEISEQEISDVVGAYAKSGATHMGIKSGYEDVVEVLMRKGREYGLALRSENDVPLRALLEGKIDYVSVQVSSLNREAVEKTKNLDEQKLMQIKRDGHTA
jgi:hypothetical protein